jgi:hypothetical protein
MRSDTRISKTLVHNVQDRRRGFLGSWITEPLVYDGLSEADVGRTVIYRKYGRAEAGTLTSWRNGIVFARYSRGDTAAGSRATDLVFGVRALDTPEEIMGDAKGAPDA